MKYLGFAKEDFPLSRVPKDDRRPLWDTTFIWLGFAFFPGAVTVAIAIASSFSVMELIPIMIIAGLILGAISAISGVIGQKEGATFGLMSRCVFGYRGMVIPSLVVPIALVGWDSINVATAALLITSIFNSPQLYYVIVIISGVLFVTTTLGGFKWMSILGKIAVPLIAVIVGIAAYISVKNAGGWGPVIDIVQEPKMSVSLAITSIVGMFAVGAGACSLDIQRFCKTPQSAVATGFLAFSVGFVFLIFFGGVAGIAAGTSDLDGLFKAVKMLGAGALAIFLLAWTTVGNDYYSASLNVCNVFGLQRHVTTIIVAVVAVILALLRSYLVLIPWLSVMSTIAVPLAGVLAADYFVVRKQKYPSIADMVDKEKMRTVIPAVRIPPFIAWAIGAAIVWICGKYGIGIPPLFGYIAAFAVHIVGCLFHTEKGQEI